MTVLFKPILALHIINFSSCRYYWRGGGQNDMFAPQYFHWGAAAPPPPPPGSTPLGLKHIPGIAAGVQGPLNKGPGILDALYSAISTLF